MGQGMEEAEVKELVTNFQQATEAPTAGSDTTQRTQAAAKERYFKMAKSISFSELRRVAQWVEAGPCGLQVLAFLGGVWLLFAGQMPLLCTRRALTATRSLRRASILTYINMSVCLSVCLSVCQSI